MKAFLPTLILLALPAAALAQQPPAQPAPGQQASDRLAQAFKQMDANGDGAITLGEWKAAGRRERGFRRVDANGDGKITPQELQAVAGRLRQRRGGQ